MGESDPGLDHSLLRLDLIGQISTRSQIGRYDLGQDLLSQIPSVLNPDPLWRIRSDIGSFSS